MELKNIALNKITRTENYRIGTHEQDVSGLMNSIKKDGLLQPIIVKPSNGSGKFEILAGNRRFNATKKLGHKTIDVVIRSKKDNNILINLVENLQREDATSYEIGRGITKLMKKEEMSISEIGARLGIAATTVRAAVSIFNETPVKYRPFVRNMPKGNSITTKKGMIPASVAQAIIYKTKKGEINKKQAEKLFSLAKTSDDMTVHKLNLLVDKISKGKSITKASKKILVETKILDIRFVLSTKDYNRLLRKYKTRGGLGTEIRKVIRKALNVKKI